MSNLVQGCIFTQRLAEICSQGARRKPRLQTHNLLIHILFRSSGRRPENIPQLLKQYTQVLIYVPIGIWSNFRHFRLTVGHIFAKREQLLARSGQLWPNIVQISSNLVRFGSNCSARAGQLLRRPSREHLFGMCHASVANFDQHVAG